MTLGSMIRAARRGKGLTQVELANRVGVGQPTLSAWERDIQNPRPERADRLSQILDLDRATVLRLASAPPATGRQPPTERPFDTITTAELLHLAQAAQALGGNISFDLFVEQLRRIRSN